MIDRDHGYNMKFIAIDVETANADMASICQIGLAAYSDGVLTNEWKSYVNPNDDFDGINVSIHGIEESDVKDSPTFKALSETLFSYLDDAVVVCHTHFDRVAIHQAASRHGTRGPQCTWLDSAKVARRTWEEFAYKGYGLKNLCKVLGYEFKHHDALEDAKASAYVFLAAIDKSGLDLDSWLSRVNQPIDLTSSQPISRSGNPEGSLYGEVIVFTGSLGITRKKAVNLASSVGCEVGSGVTKKTTLLVVGDQDIQRLAGLEKSSKHRKAEKLIAGGADIRILTESDFSELVRLSGDNAK